MGRPPVAGPVRHAAQPSRRATTQPHPILGIDPFVLWGRACIVGLLGVVLGVSGHVAAGGSLPTLDLLVVLVVLAVVGSAALLLHRASSVRLVSMLVTAQVVLHVALMAAGGGHPEGAMHGPTHGAMPMPMPMPPGSPTMGDTGTAMSPSAMLEHLGAHLPMVLAHLVAGVLVGLWLAHGERCLWTLMTLVLDRRILLLAVLVLVALVPRRPLQRAVGRPRLWGPRSIWLIRPDSLRGPPRLVV